MISRSFSPSKLPRVLPPPPPPISPPPKQRRHHRRRRQEQQEQQNHCSNIAPETSPLEHPFLYQEQQQQEEVNTSNDLIKPIHRNDPSIATVATAVTTKATLDIGLHPNTIRQQQLQQQQPVTDEYQIHHDDESKMQQQRIHIHHPNVHSVTNHNHSSSTVHPSSTAIQPLSSSSSSSFDVQCYNNNNNNNETISSHHRTIQDVQPQQKQQPQPITNCHLPNDHRHLHPNINIRWYHKLYKRKYHQSKQRRTKRNNNNINHHNTTIHTTQNDTTCIITKGLSQQFQQQQQSSEQVDYKSPITSNSDSYTSTTTSSMGHMGIDISDRYYHYHHPNNYDASNHINHSIVVNPPIHSQTYSKSQHSTIPIQQQHQNNNTIISTNGGMIIPNTNSTSTKSSTSHDLLIHQFDESEWTPYDSSYGAAIPIGGWIPKGIRRLIEFTLIVSITLFIVFFIVQTSVKSSSSDYNKNHKNDYNNDVSTTSINTTTTWNYTDDMFLNDENITSYNNDDVNMGYNN